MEGEALPSPSLRGELATSERENLKEGEKDKEEIGESGAEEDAVKKVMSRTSPLRPQKDDNQRKLAEEAHAAGQKCHSNIDAPGKSAQKCAEPPTDV